MSQPPVQSQAAYGRRHDRDSLLDAAVGVFAQEGFTAASVERVARAAGSTKPTLYARFGSKEALYSAAVEREAGRVVEHLAGAYALLAQRSRSDIVRGAIDAWLEYQVAHPASFRLLMGARHEEAAGAVVASAVTAVTTLIEELVRGGEDGKADLPGEVTGPVAAMIVGTAISAVEHLAPGVHDQAAVRLASDLASGFVLGGLSRVFSDLDR